MKAYDLMKILIKAKRMTQAELLQYAKAYYKTKKLTKKEYTEIVGLIEAM